ncbi:transcription factor tfiih subunit [Niveomyces insectorum RCEF 264]|uniref:General transcription and DNA repair factor IIH subunit TFB4 n=1 Tax=Niveomyces insectorum RCEF 264 TaxID=1081102 RepID=A0A167QBK8_9HYPO|nr:transcription factor tfiih subunit [Niveomyces insectorum RCEF 264]
MDAVDASAHYEVSTEGDTPALLTIVLDTNPRAWAALANTLPLSKAIANILVFANSHLALSSTNQVAVIASHSNRAVWLYPSRHNVAAAKRAQQRDSNNNSNGDDNGDGHDVPMTDAENGNSNSNTKNGKTTPFSANKFPQFREIEATLLQSVRDLVTSTTERDLDETTTQLAGALTLALAHINKTSILIPAAAAAAAGKEAGGGGGKPGGGSSSGGGGGGGAKGGRTAAPGSGQAGDSNDEVGLHARILVISVSDSAPAQYIATMNAVFAAAHAGVAIDVLALRGTAAFLQQAAYITRGTFIAAPQPTGGDAGVADGADNDDDDDQQQRRHAQGLLTYLMMGFSAASARDVARALVAPSADAVDFRAACFCHRRVVDTGFVCSICLSIFCEVPPAGAPSLAGEDENGRSTPRRGAPATAECLTCGSQLRLGNYGAKPAVVPRPKRKKKKRLPGTTGSGREETGSAVGTPMAP